MNAYESGTDEQRKRADRFIHKIKTGVIRKRKLPNTSEDFDENAAAESFDAGVKSDVFQRAMKEAYE